MECAIFFTLVHVLDTTHSPLHVPLFVKISLLSLSLDDLEHRRIFFHRLILRIWRCPTTNHYGGALSLT